MLLEPNISLARPGDASAIAVLSRDVIEHGLGWNWDRERILKAIRDPSINVAVVRSSDSVRGFGIMQYGETTAHLCLLGVQAALQGKSLGEALLSWLEKSAVTAGIECVNVEARADNPRGIDFYVKRGYRIQGRVPGYYGGIIDAVRLKKVLGVAR